MTDNNHEPSTESAEARNKWVEDAQAALDRTVEAMRSAWDATRESRMSALDSAKQAAKRYGSPSVQTLPGVGGLRLFKSPERRCQ